MCAELMFPAVSRQRCRYVHVPFTDGARNCTLRSYLVVLKGTDYWYMSLAAVLIDASIKIHAVPLCGRCCTLESCVCVSLQLKERGTTYEISLMTPAQPKVLARARHRKLCKATPTLWAAVAVLWQKGVCFGVTSKFPPFGIRDFGKEGGCFIIITLRSSNKEVIYELIGALARKVRWWSRCRKPFGVEFPEGELNWERSVANVTWLDNDFWIN